MDEFGLPVQLPSKVAAYLYVAGTVVCAIVSGGTWLYVAAIESDTHHDFSRLPEIIAGVIGLLPLLAGRRYKSFRSVLGPKAQALVAPAVGIAVLCGLGMLGSGILPHSSCSPNCPTSGG